MPQAQLQLRPATLLLAHLHDNKCIRSRTQLHEQSFVGGVGASRPTPLHHLTNTVIEFHISQSRNFVTLAPQSIGCEPALIPKSITASLDIAHQCSTLGERSPVAAPENLDAVTGGRALNSRASKAAVCRTFDVKRTTLIETFRRETYLVWLSKP